MRQVTGSQVSCVVIQSSADHPSRIQFLSGILRLAVARWSSWSLEPDKCVSGILLSLWVMLLIKAWLQWRVSCTPFLKILFLSLYISPFSPTESLTFHRFTRCYRAAVNEWQSSYYGYCSYSRDFTTSSEDTSYVRPFWDLPLFVFSPKGQLSLWREQINSM